MKILFLICNFRKKHCSFPQISITYNLDYFQERTGILYDYCLLRTSYHTHSRIVKNSLGSCYIVFRIGCSAIQGWYPYPQLRKSLGTLFEYCNFCDHYR